MPDSGSPGAGGQVLVVGGGHAGCEAALAAARMGAPVLLLTANPSQIARMPCNPSVGGPAKAHLVREVDALGGAMARVIDQTHIHIRNLNTGKGPAVQALRAQADRPRYAAAMGEWVRRHPGVRVVADLAEELLLAGEAVVGVRGRSGREYRAGAVVLAPGTFLGATLHLGEQRVPGGRSGEPAAWGLVGALERLGLRTGRLKTGTSPRIHRDSVDFEGLDVLAPSREPLAFSDLSPLRIPARQVDCHLTRTGPRTRAVVLENLERSPRYTGALAGAGPRYCPSLEDKFLRFPDRESHLVFLEPEGFETPELYLQGLSTSLPVELQERLVRTLPGLERAVLLRPGYAVEYAFVDPTQLTRGLQVRGRPGLFLAGQINGTSGYEEAAAQGLLAGLNAVRHLAGEEPVVLGRDQAYLGVLVDDLVARGTTEPYRMHTSRAEHRLLLRQDNAAERLTPLGRQLGLVDDERWRTFQTRSRALEAELSRLGARRLCEREASSLAERLGAPVSPGVLLADVVRRPEVRLGRVRDWEALEALDPRVEEQVEIRLKYEGYLERQEREVALARRWQSQEIPEELVFEGLAGVSAEALEKWRTRRPREVGEASRIAGVSPADVSALLVHLKRFRAAAWPGHGGVE